MKPRLKQDARCLGILAELLRRLLWFPDLHGAVGREGQRVGLRAGSSRADLCEQQCQGTRQTQSHTAAMGSCSQTSVKAQMPGSSDRTAPSSRPQGRVMTAERWAGSQRDVPVPGRSNPCGDAVKVMLLPGRAWSTPALWHSSSYSERHQPHPAPASTSLLAMLTRHRGHNLFPRLSARYRGSLSSPKPQHTATGAGQHSQEHLTLRGIPMARSQTCQVSEGKSWWGSRQHPTKGQSPPQRRVRSC